MQPAIDPTDMDPLLGASLGEFHLEEVLAAGGFGTVYRASGGPRGEAAVKVLHGEHAASAEAVARFHREVDVLGRVQHSGLADILAVGRTGDGRPWFAMELLVGCDLARRIERRGRLGAAECLAILAPIADALATAHDAGVVHRDLVASNVFLTDSGRVVLLDFGIARLTELGLGAGLTRSRQALGTPSAMAPEQVAGLPATARTDVYGLGALLYHMVTGEPPFADGSATVLQYLHCHARRPRPTACAAVPAALDEVVAVAMSLDPGARFRGPREMFAACRAALAPRGEAAAGEARAALVVRVDVRLDPDGAGDLAAALDDAEAVWSAARAHFCTRGFVPAIEASETSLFVRPLRGGGSSAEQDGVEEFQRLVVGRAGLHPTVSISVLARRGELTFSGDVPLAGDLLSIQDW
jgi:serine/threonine-protein kinase